MVPKQLGPGRSPKSTEPDSTIAFPANRSSPANIPSKQNAQGDLLDVADLDRRIYTARDRVESPARDGGAVAAAVAQAVVLDGHVEELPYDGRGAAGGEARPALLGGHVSEHAQGDAGGGGGEGDDVDLNAELYAAQCAITVEHRAMLRKCRILDIMPALSFNVAVGRDCRNDVRGLLDRPLVGALRSAP